MNDSKAPFLFVIDTEDYAGNFERELCAFITGHVGECEVGAEMAKDFEESGLEPFENIISEPDENGCHRPVTICPTPGWFNNGSGGYFEDKPENMTAALEAYKAGQRAYHGNSLWHKYLAEWRAGSNIDRLTKAGWNEEKLVKAAADEEKIVAEAEALTELPHKYPAYLSVAISFETHPTQEQIDIMKGRAEIFAALPQPTYGIKNLPIKPRISKIIGFRLIEQIITKKIQSTSV